MDWRWVGLLAGIVIVACAQAAQENDDDDGGTGGITGFTTTSAGGSTGGATAVNSTVQSANSTAASVVASTVGPGPVSSSSGSMNCAQLPTFEDCANCYCMQDPTGCQAYINVIDTYIYCGGECGSECSLYCSTLNPIDITTTCDTCIAGFDCNFPTTTQMQQDCTNFQNACLASTSCVNFVTSLQNCPL